MPGCHWVRLRRYTSFEMTNHTRGRYNTPTPQREASWYCFFLTQIIHRLPTRARDAVVPKTTLATPMFRGLRLRMTLLYAGLTVLILVVLRIFSGYWLGQQFTVVADAVLSRRIAATLTQQQLPLSTALRERLTTLTAVGFFDPTRPVIGTAFFTGQPDVLLDMPVNLDTINTYLITADAVGNPLSDTPHLPRYPLHYASVFAATYAADHVDTRTVVDADGIELRIMTVYIPDQQPRYLQVGRPMTDYNALVNQVRWVLFLGGVLGIVVVSCTAWILSGIFVRPAAAAHDRQQQFISNASHELRTPLSIVRTSAQLAQLEVPPDSNVAELLATIVSENRTMTATIDNLLTIASTVDRIPPVDPYDLAAILAAEAASTQRQAPSRSISCVIAAPLPCRSDSHYVSHLVRILLDNALAHTPDDAAITLSAVAIGAGIEIRVCDNGPGVAPEHRAHIFEPFVSYRSGTAHRGSGIGLGIANAFASALGASLRYEPNQPRGAAFVVVLPV